jgi:ABC-2 type transport system ATP-binding protein
MTAMTVENLSKTYRYHQREPGLGGSVNHYMADIEALCRRVMVIDRGQLYFDGELAALVERLAPMKQVQALYAEAVPAEQARLELDGLVLEQDDDLRRIRVAAPRDRVVEVAACLLRLGPAIDLNVEEAPVEEIVRDLFRERRITEAES